MSKQIIIIGGGLSGLSTLHYLNSKFSSHEGFQVRLLEKAPQVGGTIQTVDKNSCLFETGPNGFLNKAEGVVDLIKDLDLSQDILPASDNAKDRFISLKNKLYPLPTNPFQLLKFRPLSFRDKFRIFCEPFVPKGTDRKESVYDFGKRRLGERFSQYFLDPMVSGIFAGNALMLHMASAFPRIYELEQKHGSLIKALFSIKKEKKELTKKEGYSAQPTGQLTSLKKGMGQLTQMLTEKYSSQIRTNEKVLSIQCQGKGYVVETNHIKYFADTIIVCTPAYRTAALLKSVHQQLSSHLLDIPYAPLAVVGLNYKKAAFEKLPEGFGYLIPSLENSKILGVIISSNIFNNRCADDEIFFRVMIGGARHPDVIRCSEPEIIKLARDEIRSTLGSVQEPIHQISKIYQSAIPQYNIEYPKVLNQIQSIIDSDPNLFLVANYIGGISMNDCVKNAKLVVENLSI